MKRIVFFILLVAMATTAGNAQTKYLHTEKDGFQWYETKSENHIGVESVGGEIIIPLSRGYNLVFFHTVTGAKGYYRVKKDGKYGACDIYGKEIIAPKYRDVFYMEKKGFTYQDDQENYHNLGIKLDLNGITYSMKLRTADDGFQWYKTKSGNYEGAESVDGETIIPLSRRYEVIVYLPISGHKGYFNVMKNDKEGACDIYGNEIVEPKYSQVTYFQDGFGYLGSQGINYLGITLDANGRSVRGSIPSNNSSSDEKKSPGSVTFNDVWVTEGVVMDGAAGVIFHASFDLKGLKGKRCCARVYLQYSDGSYVKDLNGRYKDKEGDVCFDYKFRSKYEEMSVSNLWIFFPYSEMHTDSYCYPYMVIYDNHDDWVGESRSAAISQSRGVVANNNSSVNQTYNNVIQNANDVYNQGMEMINNMYKQASNVSAETLIKLGEEAQRQGGTYDNSNTYNNSNSNSSSPTRVTCPRCNGKRYHPESYTDCAEYTSYQNQAGTTCYICGKITKHCHYPCLTCQGRGTVEKY